MGAEDEAPRPNSKPVNRRMSESQTPAAARRTSLRMRSEERRPRPQRKASVGSPGGSTTSGSSRGKRFSIGESDDEDDSEHESDSDDYRRSSRSRFRSSRAVRQQPTTCRDPSRGRKSNRSRNRAASKATTTDRRPANNGPSPSGTARSTSVLSQNGLLRRTMSSRERPGPSGTARSTSVPSQNGLLRWTMSSRELPSHRRESNAGQDDGRPNRRRTVSFHSLESYSRDLLQLGQERPPPPPPPPAVIPEPEFVRPRRGRYPFESFVGEDLTLEARASVVMRSRSQSWGRPMARVAATANFIGEGVFRGASVSAPTSTNSSTIKGPSKPPRPKRPASTPPAPMGAPKRRPTTTQGLPQAPHPPARRSSMYAFKSYVGEDPTAETMASARSKSIRVPASSKKFATGPFVHGAAASVVDAAPATVSTSRRPAAGSAPKDTIVDKAALAVIMGGGDIVASPTEIGTIHVGAPWLSPQSLPSAIRLNEKRGFGDLADDEDGKTINKPAVPAATAVGIAISDDDVVLGQVDGSDEKSDISTPTKGLPARSVRRNTDAASPVESASATPFADTAAPNEFVDLEMALPVPQSSARSYDGNNIQKAPGAAAAPPALRSGKMSWFYNPGLGTKGPRAWKKRTWGLLAGVVQQAELERRAWFNTYPDYARLNYSLSDNYSGAKFFDNFNYITGYDPTGGHVHYVPRPHAEQLNLTYATESAAVARVDATVGPAGQYDRGLFVFDVAHAPHGCGTWPALWMASPHNWPLEGEIDVMEATNKGDDGNLFSLHTTKGCEMKRRREMTGVAKQADCYNGTNSNQGCNVAGPRESYGQAFNARGGGGVLAVELRDEGIRMWQFARPDVPRDLAAAAAPNPASWGTAAADFPSTDCDVGAHFRNQSIIINITLCGQLTEATWGELGVPRDMRLARVRQPGRLQGRVLAVQRSEGVQGREVLMPRTKRHGGMRHVSGVNRTGIMLFRGMVWVHTYGYK
ncbi:hypothetical protein RB594_008243 [Gaeumannomyces avenae]